MTNENPQAGPAAAEQSQGHGPTPCKICGETIQASEPALKAYGGLVHVNGKCENEGYSPTAPAIV